MDIPRTSNGTRQIFTFFSWAKIFRGIIRKDKLEWTFLDGNTLDGVLNGVGGRDVSGGIKILRVVRVAVTG